MIRLRHLSKPALLEAIRESLPPRLRRSMNSAPPRQLGEFRRASNSFIGLRFRTRGGKYEYVRVTELRLDRTETTIIARVGRPFDWRDWTGNGSECPVAGLRLRDMATRSARRGFDATKATHQMPHGEDDLRRDALGDL